MRLVNSLEIQRKPQQIKMHFVKMLTLPFDQSLNFWFVWFSIVYQFEHVWIVVAIVVGKRYGK
jgi:hypothetical protein